MKFLTLFLFTLSALSLSSVSANAMDEFGAPFGEVTHSASALGKTQSQLQEEANQAMLLSVMEPAAGEEVIEETMEAIPAKDVDIDTGVDTSVDAHDESDQPAAAE